MRLLAFIIYFMTILKLARGLFTIIVCKNTIHATAKKKFGHYIFTYTIKGHEYRAVEDTLCSLKSVKSNDDVELLYWYSNPDYCYRPELGLINAAHYVLNCFIAVVSYSVMIGVL